ncbi:uncharacterized protein LOC117338247 [Pecten maximus]|uniref:uncharacterized protein LOC117338247 n=1 Tax=Pecten maximus TaxID=6579 RepID=UPI001458BFBE|nr:uncharacterized protein LOC117338247 [Pecten maximus]
MKCSLHKDQTVIMVCQRQECETCLVCVLCIAGPHKGHEMTTLEEVGKSVKILLQEESKATIKYLEDQNKQLKRIKRMEQVNDQKQKSVHKLMEAQGQQMHEYVDKVINHMTSQFNNKYERRLKELKSIYQKTKDSSETIQTSQERLKQILETDDWIQIIQEGRKTMTVPIVEDLPEDTTPEVRVEEINKTLVTGILSALQQCQPQTTSSPSEAEVVEHTSDFEGTIYRHKTLKSVSCITISPDYISSVAPGKNDTFWVIINKEMKFCNKQGIVNNTIRNETKIRGIAIKEFDQVLTTCPDGKCVKKITSGGKQLHSFSTDPLTPNRLCVASNGDILVTLVSSFEDPIPETVGVVSRYTPQGKRMITFERDRFGNTICPKYVAASRISDMVVVTSITNQSSDNYFNGHVIVMTGDLQVKFRYLSDGQVIPGDQQYHQDISTKHFSLGIDSMDNIILGDIKSGSVEIIDKHGRRLQCLGQVDGLNDLTVSIDDQLWIGKKAGQVEVFKYM